MAEMTLQVTEQMANFLEWLNSLGVEKVQEMIQEHLDEIKANDGKTVDGELIHWSYLLEQHDGVEQWKAGGDCNKCRKVGYCLTRCKPNKMLKKITTPFLYAKYLEENPDVTAQNAASVFNTEKIAKEFGLVQ